MPVCLAMGEAAGAAAVRALKDHNNDVHAVYVPALRDYLRSVGTYLP